MNLTKFLKGMDWLLLVMIGSILLLAAVIGYISETRLAERDRLKTELVELNKLNKVLESDLKVTRLKVLASIHKNPNVEPSYCLKCHKAVKIEKPKAAEPVKIAMVKKRTLRAIKSNRRQINPQSRGNIPAKVYTTNKGAWNSGEASWYGPGLYGNSTADGTTYTQSTWCVAHKTLKFGTILEIQYNGKTVTVPVKDRGPYKKGRVLDLSAAVAKSLGFSGAHIVKWRIKP